MYQADECFIQFIEESQVSENSKRTYLAILKVFYKWFTDNGLDYYELSPVHIIRWKESLVRTKSSLTVANYLIVIKRYFSWIASNDIGKNIAAGIKVGAKYKGFLKHPLTLEQIKQLLGSIEQSTVIGKRNFALANLLVRNGLRIIEAQRINIGDITTLKGKHIIYLQRKGSHEKTHDFIVLSEKGLESIHNYLAERNNLQDYQPLFISYSRNNFGKRMNTISMSEIIKQSLNNIGLKDKRYTAHSLRHTAGVMALKNNAGEYATQLYMGHSQFKTTQLYTRMIENEMMLNNNPSILTDNIF